MPKRRGAELLTGDSVEAPVKERIAGRLDTTAVKAFLGDGYVKCENAVISTIVRLEAVNGLAIAA